jgi:hypothetical protein
VTPARPCNVENSNVCMCWCWRRHAYLCVGAPAARHDRSMLHRQVCMAISCRIFHIILPNNPSNAKLARVVFCCCCCSMSVQVLQLSEPPSLSLSFFLDTRTHASRHFSFSQTNPHTLNTQRSSPCCPLTAMANVCMRVCVPFPEIVMASPTNSSRLMNSTQPKKTGFCWPHANGTYSFLPLSPSSSSASSSSPSSCPSSSTHFCC